jgi:WD40 repeat protein
MRRLLLVAAVLGMPGLAIAGPLLKPVRPIGVGWSTDRFGWMSFAAFSPDGALIASDGATGPSDVSGNLSIWTFPGGHLVKTLKVRPEELSRDWHYYSTWHSVGRMSDGKPIISLSEKTYADWAFSPDSRYVVRSLDLGKAKSGLTVFELPSGKLLKTLDGRAGRALAVGSGGRTLAVGHWNLIALWDVPKGRLAAKLRGSGRYVTALTFSRNGRWLAAGTDWGGVELWDLQRRTKRWAVKLEGSYPSTPAFSPDGRWLAVGTYGTGTVWLIDTRKGKVVDHYKVSDIGCGSAAFSPDGRHLISPSTGGLIKWPYDRGGSVRVFRVAAR